MGLPRFLASSRTTTSCASVPPTLAGTGALHLRRLALSRQPWKAAAAHRSWVRASPPANRHQPASMLLRPLSAHAGVSVRQAHGSTGEAIVLSFDVLLGPDSRGGSLEVSALDGPAAWAASAAVNSHGSSRSATLQVRTSLYARCIGISSMGFKSKSVHSCVQVHVTPPYELWWPHGYGGQRLYRFRLVYTRVGTAACCCSSTDVRVGLRSIELRREPLAGAGTPGETFEFVVNGVPIFAKGAPPAPPHDHARVPPCCWWCTHNNACILQTAEVVQQNPTMSHACAGANLIPLDILPTRVTPERLRRTVTDAKAVHMNMLRVWGGGAYLPAAFYEACDEAGMLVWQVCPAHRKWGCDVSVCWPSGMRASLCFLMVWCCMQPGKRLRECVVTTDWPLS